MAELHGGRDYEVRVSVDTGDFHSVSGVLVVKLWARNAGEALAHVVRKVPPLWKITDATVEEATKR